MTHDNTNTFYTYALFFSYKTESGDKGNGVQYVQLGKDNNFVTKPTIEHCAALLASDVSGSKPSDFILTGCDYLGVMTPHQFNNVNQLA